MLQSFKKVETMNKLLLIMLLTLCGMNFQSCKKEPIGKWDDIIKLSQKNVNLSSEESSIMITTEGEWWWITEIIFNSEKIILDDSINTSKDFYIEHTEFSIERKNKTTLLVSMSENTSNQERILHIGLEAGNYFDGINITQSKK